MKLSPIVISLDREADHALIFGFRKIKVVDLAELSGVSPSEISDWLNCRGGLGLSKVEALFEATQLQSDLLNDLVAFLRKKVSK